MIPFNPILMDDIREALGLDDPRAVEHVWYALQAIEASGTKVVIKSASTQPFSAAEVSADITMQILRAKYGKK